MNQPDKNERNNPQKQGETCSTRQQTGANQTTDKNRDQEKKQHEHAGQSQGEKAGAHEQPNKTENQPVKKEQQPAGK
jgi:hypothetical protein